MNSLFRFFVEVFFIIFIRVHISRLTELKKLFHISGSTIEFPSLGHRKVFQRNLTKSSSCCFLINIIQVVFQISFYFFNLVWSSMMLVFSFAKSSENIFGTETSVSCKVWIDISGAQVF